MYSYEDRIKAVELYIKYDLSTAELKESGFKKAQATIRLGINVKTAVV